MEKQRTKREQMLKEKFIAIQYFSQELPMKRLFTFYYDVLGKKIQQFNVNKLPNVNKNFSGLAPFSLNMGNVYNKTSFRAVQIRHSKM